VQGRYIIVSQDSEKTIKQPFGCNHSMVAVRKADGPKDWNEHMVISQVFAGVFVI